MPKISLSIDITPRDLKILYLIYLLNTCSIDHIADRLFNGSLKACYIRVSTLRSAGLIIWNRLGSTTGVGSGKALLSLPQKGRELLAVEYLHVPASAVKPLKQISTPYGRDHHLAICDFWNALELAMEAYTRVQPSAYLEWVSERDLRTAPIKVTNSRRSSPKLRSFLPDGEFTIRLTPTVKQIFKLEMEMDPLRRPQIIKDKLAGYFDYLYSLSKDCPTSQERPFMLWVVPDSKAQAVMAQWILELSQRFGDDPSVFWLTTKAAIHKDTILSRVWQVVGVGALQGLTPENSLEASKSSFISPLPYQGSNAHDPVYKPNSV